MLILNAYYLVDADNAFNRLNRKNALHNIGITCPELKQFFDNTYGQPANLYIDGHIFTSEEGTTQGDAAAMAMYALATTPLVYDESTSAKNMVCR